jgi:hypothetical protein
VTATVRDRIITGARRWLGTPYDWSGEGLNGEGVDCSGLVIAAYREAGVPLSGRPIASQLGKMGSAVALDKAEPGDVVYFDRPGPTDHVGIYAGAGQMIIAPHTGAKVRVEGVGKPTSVRRLVTSSGTGRSVGGAFGDGLDIIGGAFGDGLDKINPFDDWAEEAMAIGLKLVGTVAALGLVVAGVMHTVKEN